MNFALLKTIAHTHQLSEFPAVTVCDCTLVLEPNGRLSIDTSSPLSQSELSSVKTISIAFNNPWLHHYFHFMEMLIAACSMQKVFFPHAVVEKIFVGGQIWNSELTFCKVAKVMFPQGKIISAKEHGDHAQNGATLLLDLTKDGQQRDWNKYLEPYLLLATDAWSDLRGHVLGGLGVKTSISSGLKAIYVYRKPPRSIDNWLLDKLMRHITSAGFEVRAVDFGLLPLEEQVAAAADADLLIGVHGNGLTNCLWQKPGSTLIEIFPPGCHHYDYQFFAELSGLQYFGVEAKAKGGFVYTNGARMDAAYGAVNEPIIADLPWKQLHNILNSLSGGKRSSMSAVESSKIDAALFQRKSFSQFGEDGVVEWFFHGRERGFYVDLGCHHPYRLSNTALLYLKGWTGINIDVDERAIFAFREERPRDISVCTGVGNRVGELEVTLFDEGALNTFDDAWAAHPAWAHIGRRRTIAQIRPLRDLLKTHLPSGQRIAFLNVDAECFDLEILQSNDWVNYRPELVAAETSSINYENVRSHPIVDYMYSQKYTLISHVVGTAFFRAIDDDNIS